MGLDTVELVIRFEEAFAISIPDKVAETLTTPRKVTEYIISQVETSERQSCLTQQAFYFLREKFVRFLGLAPNDFRPSLELESLFPKEDRSARWNELRSQFDVNAIPVLERPRSLVHMLIAVTALTFLNVVMIAATQFGFGLGSAVALGLITAAVVAWLGEFLTRSMRLNFPKDYQTTGDLTKYLILYSPHVLKRNHRTWTREQVAAVIRELIVDQTGVTDFNEDSQFVRDMHLD
jgi:hypothetical protein